MFAKLASKAISELLAQNYFIQESDNQPQISVDLTVRAQGGGFHDPCHLPFDAYFLYMYVSRDTTQLRKEVYDHFYSVRQMGSCTAYEFEPGHYSRPLEDPSRFTTSRKHRASVEKSEISTVFCGQVALSI